MKYLVLFLLVALVTSCGFESDGDSPTKLYHEYNPVQATTLKVEVYPCNGVYMQFEDMVLETNADYFNRYGIAVEFTLMDEIELGSQYTHGNQVYIPKSDKPDVIKVYVVPENVIKLPALAYANTAANGIVLGENVQTNRTLTHEIAHLLGLNHTDIPNNVMTPRQIAWQFDKPNDFNEAQIDSMLTTLSKPKAKAFGAKSNLVICKH